MSKSIGMSAAGLIKWQAALTKKRIGTAIQFLANAPSITGEPTARKALKGEKLGKTTWESIFQDLGENRGDFFTDAEWFGRDLLKEQWAKLLELAEDASDRFGLVLPDRLERADLRGAKSKYPSKYMTKLRINSKVLLEIPSGLSGYLILLEQNKDGGINLISPSQLMKNTLLTGEAQRLPQLPVDEDIAEVIEMTDEGTRYLWAGIFAQLPDWGWLVGAKDDTLELQVEQLRDLLGYAKHQPPGTQIWRSSYTVMA
jgi:hypothetical protein